MDDDIKERITDTTHEWGVYEDGELVLHNIEDDPALMKTIQSKSWYNMGNLNREIHPAIERSDGSKEWFKNGERPRSGEPNIIREDGTSEHVIYYSIADKPSLVFKQSIDGENTIVYQWHNEYGLHRGRDEPAVIWKLVANNMIVRTEWYTKGLRHRKDNPAIIEYDKNGSVSDESWYQNGRKDIVADVRFTKLKILYKNESIDKKELEVDLTKTGYDGTHEISIRKYLQDPDNVVFLFKGHVFLSSISGIRIMLDNKNALLMMEAKKPSRLRPDARETSVVFKCHQADTAIIPRHTNVIKFPYMLTRTFIALDVLIPLHKIVQVVHIGNTTSRIYLISDDPMDMANATTTLSMLDNPNANAVSSTHCGPGTEKAIHNLFEVVNTKEVDAEPSPEPSSTEEPVQSSTLTILYKNIKYELPITVDHTLGNLKQDFLQHLVEKNIIPDMNKRVDFIFRGQRFREDAMPITQMANPPFGIVVQAMVLPVEGGKTKKRPFMKKYKTTTRKRRNL